MNKRAARTESMASTITIGELKAMVAERRLRGGMSKVNPSFSAEQICDIYEGALKNRADDEVPQGMTYSAYKDKKVASRDSLMIRNILRDCK